MSFRNFDVFSSGSAKSGAVSLAISKLQIRWIFWTISWHFADFFCFRDRKWLKAFPIGLHPHFYDLFVIQIIEVFFFQTANER